MDFSGIKPNDLVTITKMKHIVEVQYLEKHNTDCRIRKIDKDRYIDKSTGEIHEFEHIENRQESLNSLRQTFKKLRYLINNNFEGKANELFITLTYRGDQQTNDTKKLYVDFDKFIKRLRYAYKDKTTIDYINVLEPHASGNFHMHVLMRFNDLETIYIPNDELAEIWGNGFVKIQSLKNVDNIGAYVSAYLSDIDVTDHENVENMNYIEKEVNGQKKKFVKGARLMFYPPGVNIFRKSKGIVYPERENMCYQNAKKIVGSAKPHYSKVYQIDTEEFQNTIYYEQYNLKR